MDKRLNNNDLCKLIELGKLKDVKLRAKIASNSKTPANILELLSQDHDIDVLCKIGSNPNTPERILQDLLKIKDSDLLYSIGTNPNISIDFINKLTKKKSCVFGLIDNSKLPEYYYLNFYNSNNLDLKIQLARSRYTPIDILEKLANEQNTFITSEHMYNDNITKIFHKLIHSSNFHIRARLAFDERTPKDVFEQLVNDSNEYVRSNLASRNDISLEIIKKLSMDTDPSVRASVASNSKTPQNILKYLSKDNDIESRKERAKSSTSPEELEKLVEDEQPTI